jgi:hypothetical protein
MANTLEKYFHSPYTYTQYIPELSKRLGKNPALILANLLAKMHAFNPNAQTRQIYGKPYHFHHTKKSIAERELTIGYKEFNQYIAQLTQYVTTFAGRQKDQNGYNTTYFYLHLGNIHTLFQEGAEMLGKKITPTVEPAQKAKTDRQKPTGKNIPQPVIQLLQTINQTENEYRAGKISEAAYRQTILEIQGIITKNNYQIQKNQKSWQIH